MIRTKERFSGNELVVSRDVNDEIVGKELSAINS